jgi:hypothetical protein
MADSGSSNEDKNAPTAANFLGRTAAGADPNPEQERAMHTDTPLFTAAQLAAEIAPRGRGHAGRQPWERPAHWTPSYVVCWQGILIALDGQCEIEDACIGEVDEFEDCHPSAEVTDDAALGIVQGWPGSLIAAVGEQTAPDDRQGD